MAGAVGGGDESDDGMMPGQSDGMSDDAASGDMDDDSELDNDF